MKLTSPANSQKPYPLGFPVSLSNTSLKNEEQVRAMRSYLLVCNCCAIVPKADYLANSPESLDELFLQVIPGQLVFEPFV